jgi:hypothetical protein
MHTWHTNFCGQWPIRSLSWEEPVLRPNHLSVLAEDGEQSGREHHLAVLVSLQLQAVISGVTFVNGIEAKDAA